MQDYRVSGGSTFLYVHSEFEILGVKSKSFKVGVRLHQGRVLSPVCGSQGHHITTMFFRDVGVLLAQSELQHTHLLMLSVDENLHQKL